MDLKLTNGEHKSLRSPFEWNQIPNFAVITGPNGSGKTHLLELIDWAFHPERKGQRPALSTADVSVVDGTYHAREVAFLADWGLAKARSSPPGAVGALVSDFVKLLRGDTGVGNPY